ncbi:MAG: hypothetical protein ABGX65_03795 [Acidimicrobiales bacterium]
MPRLPWVGHKSRSWEPEPFRWLGMNTGIALANRVDAREAQTGRMTWHTKAMSYLVG